MIWTLCAFHVSRPFRAKHLFCLTQGEPWAMLSWPLRAVGLVLESIGRVSPFTNEAKPN
jgi:hypothetical protein